VDCTHIQFFALLNCYISIFYHTRLYASIPFQQFLKKYHFPRTLCISNILSHNFHNYNNLMLHPSTLNNTKNFLFFKYIIPMNPSSCNIITSTWIPYSFLSQHNQNILYSLMFSLLPNFQILHPWGTCEGRMTELAHTIYLLV
jgi:hypothetical protein